MSGVRRMRPDGHQSEDGDLSNWNPMYADYENRDFNRYSQGVGRDLMGGNRGGQGVRLYVDGIPMDLGQDGLYNLFAEYGNVLDCKLVRGNQQYKTGYGFITVESPVEAELCVRMLHKKSLGSGFLKVQPAITEEEKERRRRMQQAENHFTNRMPMQRPEEAFHQGGPVRRPPLHVPGNFHRPPIPAPLTRGLLGPPPAGLFGPGPIGRGFGPRPGFQMPDHPFGHPGQGMGRGQGFIPPPKSGHVEARKTCLNCKKQGSKYRCQSCKMYYCSQECQKEDWSRHKEICQVVREYIEENLPPGLQTKIAENLDGSANDSNAKTSSDISNTKALKPLQAAKVDSDTTKGNDDGYESDRRKTQAAKEKNLNDNKSKKNSNLPDVTKQPNYDKDVEKERLQGKENTCPNLAQSNQGQVAEAGDASSNLIQQLDVDEGSSGKCLLTCYESPNRFWVIKEDSLMDYLEMAGDFHKFFEMSETPTKVKAGDIVGAVDQAMWSRARVTNIRGNNITVFFVDTGRQDIVQLENLKVCLEELLQFPQQVLCCCLSQVKPVGTGSWSEAANSFVKEWLGTPETREIEFTMVSRKGSTFAMDLSIDGVSLKDELIKRRLAELSSGQPGLPSCTVMRNVIKEQESSIVRNMVKDMPSLACDIQVGSEVFCMMQSMESPTKIWLTPVVEKVTKTHEELQIKIADTEKDKEPYTPLIGELVMAKYSLDGAWYRAAVEASETDNEFTLLFIDYGNKEITTPASIRKVKDELLYKCPAQVLHCAMHGVEIPPSIDNASLLQEFHLLFEEYKDQGSNFHKVVVKSINQDQCSIDIVHPDKDKSLAETVKTRIEALCHSATTGKSSQAALNANTNPKTVPKANSENKEPMTNNTQQKSSPPSDHHTENRLKKQPGLSKPDASSNTNEAPSIMKSEELPTGKVKVVGTFFKSCEEFYVTLNKKDYFALMKKINNNVPSKPALKKPTPGILVAALFLMDKNFYRARVEKVEGENVTVLFLDFGNTEIVQCSHLRALPLQAQSLPAQAICCRFKEIPECPEVIMREFKNWFEDQTFFLKSTSTNLKQGNAIPVDVFKMDGEDVCALLKSEGQKAQVTQATLKQEKAQVKTAAVKSPNKQKIVNIEMEKNQPCAASCVYALSPMEFYVQINAYLEQAQEITLNLTLRLKSEPCPVTSVASGDFVAGRFSQDETVIWYRSKVLTVESNKCVIHFVDYGNCEECNVSDLMQLKEEDFETPACTLKCCLKGCSEETMEMENLDSLATIEQVIVLEQCDNMCSVDILDAKGDSMADLFKKKTVTKSPVQSPSAKLAALLSPKKPQEEPESNLSYETLPQNGESIQVMITEVKSCSEVFVATLTHVQEVVDIQEAIKTKGDSLPILKNPRVGAVCATQFSQDQSWYRAIVEEICGPDRCVVRFYDYGNSEETSNTQLKQLPQNLSTLKAQGIKCCFQGHFSHNNAVDSQMVATLQSEVYDVQVVAQRDGVFEIAAANEVGPVQVVCEAASPPVPTVNDLDYPKPAQQFDAIVLTCDSLGDFYCMTQEHLGLASALSLELESDCPNQESSPTPVVGGIYACNFEDVWYRCQVCKVKESTVDIKYIDFGNEEERKAEDLRMLSPQHLKLPVYLIRCKLHGVEPATGVTWSSPELQDIYASIKDESTSIHVSIVCEDSEYQAVNLQATVGDDIMDIAELLLGLELVQAVNAQAQVPYGAPIMNAQGDNSSQGAIPAASASAVSPHHTEQEEDEDELEIQRQIAELQRKLQMKKGGRSN